jgi:hypothetical protein
MDTTGAHINGNATPKDKDYTKEELSAILKFGAQNLFKTDEGAQTQKLDEMDLDDVLTKADAFDTEAAGAGTTSLGGEGFLSSFAEIQDVKNDMDVSWDEIIPVDERAKMDEELAEEAAVELGSRKRTATRPVSYEGMDSDAKKLPLPRKSNAQRALELKGESRRVLADDRTRLASPHSRPAKVGRHPESLRRNRQRSPTGRQESRHDHPDVRRHFASRRKRVEKAQGYDSRLPGPRRDGAEQLAPKGRLVYLQDGHCYQCRDARLALLRAPGTARALCAQLDRQLSSAI